MSVSGLWARPIADILARRPELTDNILQKKSKVSQKTISRVRLGGRISLESADKLCIALGYSLPELYGEGEGEPTLEDRRVWADHLASEQARQNGANGARRKRAS